MRGLGEPRHWGRKVGLGWCKLEFRPVEIQCTIEKMEVEVEGEIEDKKEVEEDVVAHEEEEKEEGDEKEENEEEEKGDGMSEFDVV